MAKNKADKITTVETLNNQKFYSQLLGAITAYSDVSGYTKEDIINKLDHGTTTQAIIKNLMLLAVIK